MSLSANKKTKAVVAAADEQGAGLSEEIMKALHLKMVRIRRFELEAGRLMEENKVPGGLHLYVGEEAVAAGVMQHLNNEDQITSTHRGHGHLIAKGGEFKPMFAELLGRAPGYCRGKGGSMHISSMELGMLGANGIVGGGQPIAMGAAFANKFLKRQSVAVTFFGDGAANEGSVHESMNMAALYKLPCIFVCENNGYSEYMSQANSMVIVDIADRAAGYGMPGVVVDGMDATAVYQATEQAVERARTGGGPTLIECKTYRYYDHVGMRGMGKNYRTEDEVEEWKKRDPIEAIERQMIAAGLCSQAQIDAVYESVNKDIEDAIQFAFDAPFPDPSELLEDVYCESEARK